MANIRLTDSTLKKIERLRKRLDKRSAYIVTQGTAVDVAVSEKLEKKT